MRRKHARQQVIQAQIQSEEIKAVVMYWFPAGFAVIGLILHIFPKMTLSM
jgi:hypothetical protein